jgi:hypothetical protein
MLDASNNHLLSLQSAHPSAAISIGIVSFLDCCHYHIQVWLDDTGTMPITTFKHGWMMLVGVLKSFPCSVSSVCV